MDGRPPLPPAPRGRGAANNPPNRFTPILVEWDPDWLEEERLQGMQAPQVATECFEDHAPARCYRPMTART